MKSQPITLFWLFLNFSASQITCLPVPQPTSKTTSLSLMIKFSSNHLHSTRSVSLDKSSPYLHGSWPETIFDLLSKKSLMTFSSPIIPPPSNFYIRVSINLRGQLIEAYSRTYFRQYRVCKEKMFESCQVSWSGFWNR